ncbi:D-xylose ABC transporter substrate-binding protein [Truepera radiovictrix]|uniref:D-xylose-binding periplasmic protein n=1 Tax=Truepera radiovictrix (strain DSM 17093 / CIP 108686 / LMG 22925 / RQ-24) TaxID=649638 RepID=D7CWH3_TRURR|nr:D-xylose ABC transporter substrate-binding protein [Truepera radiovictrix]ADI14372.1 D-xylose ABC transporter, periplasmic substrate-binding protein [Truepera radiovictrix DSM 17093]WMT57071.1 D-xylose ABC transporter substrate-binding protein [Truepera radiovictrix]
MKRLGVLGVFVFGAVAAAQTVGVSWSNFQEERWRTDEAAIRETLEALGAQYVSADAQSSPEKQLADVESLITRGVDALIILAQDNEAILPAVSRAAQEGIPVVAYDRLIEDPGVFYLTFDNVEVGRLQAQAVYDVQPTGNYVFIKGSPTDPNADFLHQGQLEVLQSAIDSGDITVVGEQYTDGWLPENAQRNTEQILTANNNEVDAVVASNDGTAGGVVAALTAQGLEGIPVSGQDGDHAALNRIALGTQTVSVWKDARELGRAAAEIAVALAQGAALDEIEGATTWSDGPRGVEMNAILLEPIPITRDNLEVVIDAGWVDRDTVCAGVDPENAPSACQ